VGEVVVVIDVLDGGAGLPLRCICDSRGHDFPFIGTPNPSPISRNDTIRHEPFNTPKMTATRADQSTVGEMFFALMNMDMCFAFPRN